MLKQQFKGWFDSLLGARFAAELKFEISSAWACRLAALKPSQRTRLKQLKQRKDLKLHLGSGANLLPGWVNIDIASQADIVMDMRRGLPFPGGCAQYVFTEHFLEHLDFYLEVPHFLSECYRVLRIGGTVRVVVPDAETFAAAYSRHDLAWFNFVEPSRHFATPGEGLAFNFQYAGQHHSGWDFETLALKLRAVGFQQVEKTDYRAGPLSVLNLERDLDIRAAHSLCVNATK